MPFSLMGGAGGIGGGISAPGGVGGVDLDQFGLELDALMSAADQLGDVSNVLKGLGKAGQQAGKVAEKSEDPYAQNASMYAMQGLLGLGKSIAQRMFQDRQRNMQLISRGGAGPRPTPFPQAGGSPFGG